MSRAAHGSPLGRAPLVLLVPAGAAVLLLLVPLVSLLVVTPWARLPELVASREVLEALRLTGVASLATVVLCLLVGTPLAWVLARVEFRGRSLVRALVTVPLVLPPVVAGVALVAALGRSGVVGAPLRDLTGLVVPYTTPAVVVAHTFVAMPFFVLSVEGALRASGERYDAVAASLGASRWTTFRRVTLPLAMPGVVAGGVLAWARSLGEFGATVTFAGNYPGVTQTMPSLIYQTLQNDRETAQTISIVLLGVSILVLALLRNRWLDRAPTGPGA
ncbi:ABC transporter permease [Nocardioides lentus]|uniref:Molybdenum transport system permease n=1 Tax=Nocardioides lentus TaxID=338077 RepID=A0ABP5AMM4_9ACTN